MDTYPLLVYAISWICVSIYHCYYCPSLRKYISQLHQIGKSSSPYKKSEKYINHFTQCLPRIIAGGDTWRTKCALSTTAGTRGAGQTHEWCRLIPMRMLDVNIHNYEPWFTIFGSPTINHHWLCNQFVNQDYQPSIRYHGESQWFALSTPLYVAWSSRQPPTIHRGPIDTVNLLAVVHIPIIVGSYAKDYGLPMQALTAN